MNDALVALAVRLRVTWFEEIGPALDAVIPGAWEALAATTVRIDDEGQVVVRVPPVHPVLPLVHRLVREAMLPELKKLVPDRKVVLRFAKAVPSARKPAATELDVHAWGDPPPADWPQLTEPLFASLAATPVLSVARLGALSTEAVWIRFPSVAARRAVGSTPGAAFALRQAVEAWYPKTKAFLYADS